MLQVKNKKTGEILAVKVDVAKDIFSRMIGLMFKNSLGESDGLLIAPCNSIHTFFMKFNLDIIFMNSESQVVKVIEDIPPWRITRMYWSARKVLELKGGTLKGSLSKGDYLEVKSV